MYQTDSYDRLDYPRPRKINGFDGQHNVESGRVVIVDAQTFLIPSFNYDGQAPDAHFWVGTGQRPGPEGNYNKNSGSFYSNNIGGIIFLTDFDETMLFLK